MTPAELDYGDVSWITGITGDYGGLRGRDTNWITGGLRGRGDYGDVIRIALLERPAIRAA